jgi:RES domain-containing protein
MIAAPPSPFPTVNRQTLAAGSGLHRIHSSDFDSNAFNPCRGRSTRFAPLLRPDGSCIPTAHAASTFECAVHETVFHEIQHDAGHKSIAFHQIERLDYAKLTVRRDLMLAALYEPDLNRWKISRRDLVDTFALDYPDTAKWAIAIHDAASDVDGLVWTSRRCDPDRAHVLFGDRVRPDDLSVDQRERIARSNLLLGQVRNFADRANILIAF